MTRIDFYVLSGHTLDKRLEFCCKLIEKAYKNRLSICVYHSNLSVLEQLDEMLWAFKSESFIPHKISNSSEHEQSKMVYLTDQSPPEQISDYLINLDNKIPSFFSHFKRLSEIVSQDQETTLATREHFKQYRSKGYPLTTHDLRHKH